MEEKKMRQTTLIEFGLKVNRQMTLIEFGLDVDN